MSLSLVRSQVTLQDSDVTSTPERPEADCHPYRVSGNPPSLPDSSRWGRRFPTFFCIYGRSLWPGKMNAQYQGMAKPPKQHLRDCRRMINNIHTNYMTTWLLLGRSPTSLSGLWLISIHMLFGMRILVQYQASKPRQAMDLCADGCIRSD